MRVVSRWKRELNCRSVSVLLRCASSQSREQKCLRKSSCMSSQASPRSTSSLQKFLSARRLQQSAASLRGRRKSARWKYFLRQKAMLMAVMAKKKPALSFSICSTSERLRFTKRRISCKESTPPPRKSVSGYCPWKPSRIHSFPETCAGWRKYSLQRDFTRSHRGWSSKSTFASSLSATSRCTSACPSEQSSQRKHSRQWLLCRCVSGSPGRSAVSLRITQIYSPLNFIAKRWRANGQAGVVRRAWQGRANQWRLFLGVRCV